MSVAHRNSRMRNHPTPNRLSPMPGGRSLFRNDRQRRSQRVLSCRQRRADRGSAFVLAVILLAIFAILAAGFAAETGMNLQKAGNLKRLDSARLEAESGIAYLSYLLKDLSLPSGVTGQAMLDSLASALQEKLNGTANLGGQLVTYNGSQILVPKIDTDGQGAGFEVALTLEGDNVRATVTGHELGCARRVRMDFETADKRSFVFDYGVASRGKIVVNGGASVRGAVNSSEAKLLGASYSDLEAASLTGGCEIEGDVYISNPDAHVTLAGPVSVGGETLASGNIDEHVHIGVGDVEFPGADPSVFEPFATNIVDASTDTSADQTFENIRILAGTNPTFSGTVTIKGVVYIETPNRVEFTGQVDLTGVVVTEDAGEDATDNNYIHFTGATSATGVEELPDEPQFAGLKSLPGTFLLAPGFSVLLTGNVGTLSGAVAAEELKAAGTVEGTVRGPVIVWGNHEMTLSGASRLTIDRTDSPQKPPGLTSSLRLVALPRTYEEL